MQNKNTSSITSLYLLKAICAFGVVVLHAPISIVTDFLREYFAMTVPIFLMITGYFLYNQEWEKFSQKCIATTKKIIPIIIICNIVYYPFSPVEGSIRDT